MKIEFGTGELSLEFVNERGEVIMTDTLSCSGPDEATVVVEYPTTFTTEKGKEKIIPVCIGVTRPRQLRIDGAPPLDAVLARCKKLRCSRAVTDQIKARMDRVLKPQKAGARRRR